MSSENEQNFAHFRKLLEQLGTDLDDSAQRVVTQMAGVGMAVTKKNTPVGDYPAGEVGGTLRKGWRKGATLKVGNGYESSYANNVYYGLYVNNGHRIVGKDGATVGYVKGKRMLEQGVDAAKRQNETLFRNEIARVKQKGGW